MTPRHDITHDMYLPDPPRRIGRPTPARDRNLDIFADPNGTRAQREAWMKSRRAKPRKPKIAGDQALSLFEYAIARVYAQLAAKTDLSQDELNVLDITAQEVESYASRK